MFRVWTTVWTGIGNGVSQEGINVFVVRVNGLFGETRAFALCIVWHEVLGMQKSPLRTYLILFAWAKVGGANSG